MADAAPTAPSTAPAGKRRRVWLKILAAWLGAVAIVFAGWTGWTMYQVRAATARCRAAGLPITVEALRVPEAPDDVNARVAFEQIAARATKEPIAAWLEPGDDLAWLQELRSIAPRPLTDAEQFKLASLLEQPAAKALLDAGREAALRQGYWPKNDYRLDVSRTELPLLRNLVELLGARARLAANRGNRNAAAADLSAALALVTFPASDPSLIAQLTCWSCLQIAVRSIQQVCHVRGLPNEAAADFGSRLHRLTPAADLGHALDAERIVVGNSVFEHALSARGFNHLNEATFGNRFVTRAYLVSGLGRLDYADYMDRMRLIRLELADNAHSPRQQIDRLQQITSGIPRYHVLSLIAMPTFASIAKKAWAARMTAAVGEIGLALERYRATNGRFPEELGLLVPDYLTELPRDAFIDEPLVYRTTRESALVYSVGPNGTDDAGAFDSEKKKDDVAWISTAAR